MNNLILLTVVLFLSLVSAYQGPDLPPGPYCGKDFGQNGRCCEDRQDGCAHPIKETLCYCDVFCKRNRPFDDCCPDYETVCEGAPEPIKETFHCTYHDKLYLPGDPADIGCNKCTCTVGPNNSTSWACSQDTCMVHDNITHEINRRQADWEAFTYPEFLDKKLRDGVIYKLGTIELEAIMGANAISPPNADMMEDRSSFDARVEWPRYITPVRDQGWCGSDWAVSSAAIASDRFAILSKGAEHMELSPQLFLSCMKGKPPCRGGRIDSAWNFARNFGMVDEQCFPYHAERTRCPFKKRGTLRQDGCRPSVKERTDRYRMSPLVRLNGERAMMADIMLSGPLQAVMTVYQDFFHYRRGIYRHLPVGDQRIFGRHAVRVVGWGEERGEKYWIVANSWGRQWGEEGYFRILRGSNESEIEHFVVSALPEVSEAYQRK